MVIKRNIARILLIVSIMFTVVFQLVHTYEHIESAIVYENEHGTHDHYNNKTASLDEGFQRKEHHQKIDHCFVCDFILKFSGKSCIG